VGLTLGWVELTPITCLATCEFSFFLLRQLHGGVPGGVIHGPWLAEGLTSLQQEKATTCLHPHLTEAREVRCRVGSEIAYE